MSDALENGPSSYEYFEGLYHRPSYRPGRSG